MNNTYTPLKDALTSTGQAYTMDNLKSLATSKGINDYTGTDTQNLRLAKMLQPTMPQVNNGITNPTITPLALDTMKNTPVANVPSAPVVSPLQPVQNMADTILKQTNVPLSPIEQQANELQMKIANTLPNLQGEQQALIQARDQAGVNKFNAQLQDLNNQINIKTAQLNQGDIQLAQSLQNVEDKPIAMEFITGEQASIQRNAAIARAMKASEIGVLNAQAVAAQGNIALAQNMAQQAVDAQFAPQKDLINTYKAQLEAIQPLLTQAEKQRANEQTLRTNLALKQLDQQQQDKKDVTSMVVNASAQGAPANLITKATNAKTPSEAAAILGQYAGDYWGMRLKMSEVAKNNAAAKASTGTNTGTSGGIAKAYLAQYNSGALDLKDIYTQIPNTKEGAVIQNQLAKLVAAQGGKRVLSMGDAQVANIKAQVNNINDLLNGDVGSTVGIVQGGFGVVPDSLNVWKQNALAIADNLIANQTLQSLADAKAKGITFGALSEAELNAVANAASRVASKAVKDKTTGKIIGFTGSESELIKDLKSIKTGLENSVADKTGQSQNEVDRQIQAATDALNSSNINPTGGYQFK